MSTFMILIYYDYQFIAEINQSFIQQIKPKIDDFLLPMASFRTCTHTTHKCHEIILTLNVLTCFITTCVQVLSCCRHQQV